MARALILVIHISDDEAARILINCKPEIIWQHFPDDGQCFSPLLEAVRYGRASVIQMNLDYGANINAPDEGHTQLHVASRLKEDTTVHFLVASGADLEVKESTGKMPLYDASICCLNALLKFGAKVNATDNKEGQAPLHYVSTLWPDTVDSPKDRIQVLLNAGGDLEARDHCGCMALHVARWPENVEILLQNGANVDSRNSKGWTPLHQRADESFEVPDPRMIKILLEHGADIEARDHTGSTPLHLAAQWPYSGDKVVECLI
ncbi:ankyrin repeat-containing domain protein [Tricladium varicosporioides]|nr:ankyrin repeat-containing domain protein [Hymenoscyphus varicosporioides]